MFVRTRKGEALTVEWTQTIEDLLGDPRQYGYSRPMYNPVDPEPCDTCETGIAKFVSHDGFRRCQNCIRARANEMGWDEVPKRKVEVLTGEPGDAKLIDTSESIKDGDNPASTGSDRQEPGPSSRESTLF